MTGEKDGDTTPVTHFALIFSLLRLGDTSARRFANLIESIQRNTSSTFTNWWTWLIIRFASSWQCPCRFRLGYPYHLEQGYITSRQLEQCNLSSHNLRLRFRRTYQSHHVLCQRIESKPAFSVLSEYVQDAVLLLLFLSENLTITLIYSIFVSK